MSNDAPLQPPKEKIEMQIFRDKVLAKDQKENKPTISGTQIKPIVITPIENIPLKETPKITKKKKLDPPDHLEGWQKTQWWVRHGILYSEWFETSLLIIIIINCILLAMEDPHSSDNLLEAIRVAEIIFTIIYIVEMLTKFVGLGIYGEFEEMNSREVEQKEQKETLIAFMTASVFRSEKEVAATTTYVGYFNDGWNCFDFSIIVIGSIIPLFTATRSISSLRALRILRALRTIPRIPKLRALVMTLIDSLRGLSGSAALVSFFAIIFGIIGLGSFSGELDRQCFDSNGVMLTYRILDQDYFSLCNSQQQCDDIAKSVNATGSYTCQDKGLQPQNNLESFNDIGHSLLAVFQTAILNEWSFTLYDLAQRTGYEAWVFFVAVTLVLSFFSFNLLLAVIADTYSRSLRTVQGEADIGNVVQEIDHLINLKATQRVRAPIFQQTTYANYERQVRHLKSMMRSFEEFRDFSQPVVEAGAEKHELMRKKKLRVDTERNNDAKEQDNKMVMELQQIAEELENETKYDLQLETENKESWWFSQRAAEQVLARKRMVEEWMKTFNRDLTISIWEISKPIKNTYLDNKPMFVLKLNEIVQEVWFENLMLIVILLNTIVLALIWPDMDSTTKDSLEILNIIFTIIFAIELAMKFIGLGPERWAHDRFNIYDGIIVLVSVIDLIISSASNQPNVGDVILAFRALRVLRILRLFHRIQSLSILLNAVLEAIEPIGLLLGVMALFLFMFGVLGVQMFSTHVEDLKTTLFTKFTRPWKFDNLWYSILSFTQLFSGDGWFYVMTDVTKATSYGAVTIVIIAVILGLFVFKNLCLAVLINRLQNQDEIQLMLDELLRKGQILWRKYSDDQEKGKKELEELVRDMRKKQTAKNAAARHAARVERLQNREKISGVSLRLFTPINPFRVFLHKIVQDERFEWAVIVLIILNCIFLGLHSPHVKDSSGLGVTLYALDNVFTAFFCLELLLKVIAYGLYESRSAQPEQNLSEPVLDVLPNSGNANSNQKSEESGNPSTWGPCKGAYLKSWWNRFDMLVVIVSIFGLIFPRVTFLRGLRAIRPIRIAIRVKEVKVVVKALLRSTHNVINGVLFGFIVLFIMAIVGTQLFCGKLARCVEAGKPYVLVDSSIYPDKDSCQGSNVAWVNAGYDFDNVFSALLAVFKISNFVHWYEDLAVGMASSSNEDKQAVPFQRPAVGIYYIFVAIIGGFFLWNIIVSVVIDAFMRTKQQEATTALITQDQAIWIRTKRYAERFPLVSSKKSPREPWRKKIFRFVTSLGFDYFIMGCIIVNVIFMMSSYESSPMRWDIALWAIDIFFVVIYTIEAILKIIGLGVRQYFRDLWNVFDFLIVIVSIITIAFSVPGQHQAANGVRLIRVIRVVRLLRRAPVLRALFMTLVYAAPSLLNIGLLVFVVFFIWGIFGMELFGKIVHNDGYGNFISYNSNDGVSDAINFENFGRSLLVLYRIATNDNWASIMLAIGADGDRCPTDNLTRSSDDTFTYECGNYGLAIAYFVTFSIFGTLVMMNLFIAVILDTYADNVDFEKRLEKLEIAKEWSTVWKRKDKEENTRVRGRLSVKNFIATLKDCPVLVGLMLQSLNLRLHLEDDNDETQIDYSNVEIVKKKSVDLYGRVDFVGEVNNADAKVTVTNDHINAILTSRRLRLLCRLRQRGTLNEKLVVYYDEALFAIASLVVGPEFRLLPYHTDKYVHISDWWEEQMEEISPTF